MTTKHEVHIDMGSSVAAEDQLKAQQPVIESFVKEALGVPDKPKLKIVKEFLRYDFTESEMKAKASELSLALQRKERAEMDQKAAQAQFKERIEAQTNIISRVSREYQAGYEFRDIECHVEFHTPTVGSKRITRIDTGELVRECAMRNDELQENLFSEASDPVEENEA